MEITFTNKKFEKLANDDRKLVKEFGKIRAEKISTRLTQLRSAATLEDVRHLPGNFHELTANRKGQWACDLKKKSNHGKAKSIFSSNCSASR